MGRGNGRSCRRAHALNAPAQSIRQAAHGVWVPIVFVVLWSTGFVVAKYASPHAPPLTFLLWRYSAAVAVLLPVIALTRAPWPRTRAAWLHTAVAGILLQATYLGGVWYAIAHGLPAGIAALVVGTQPLLTAVAAGVIGERASARQWSGLILGFAGVVLVVWDRLTGQGIDAAVIAIILLALAGITAGTLYQKRFGGATDLRTGAAIQFAASLVVTAPLAAALESLHVDLVPAFWGALAWSVIVLSLAAMVLLLAMIRRGRATEVASLMYLTPPMTAALAWLIFGERLTAVALTGIAVTVLGVALVVERKESNG